MRRPFEQLYEAIGHKFTNTHLIDQAMTHRSAGSVNNERLEFLGDAILGFVIADELHRLFADADEGQLSRLRSGLVKKDSLASLARLLNLGDYLRLGPGELRSGGPARSSILADALEAVFAAVYLDAGYPIARETILNLFRERLLSLTPHSQQKDPKSQLQEYLQARKYPLPEYNVVEIGGDQHAQLFKVVCVVSALGTQAQGKGASRRKAEQDAAVQVLKALV